MRIPELRPAAPYFSGGAGFLLKAIVSLTTPENLHRVSPSSNPESLVIGLRHLLNVARRDPGYFHTVYSPEEIRGNNTLSDVKLFHFPGHPDRPFVLLCAGGGFACVSNYTESFPIAARLNDWGYTVFALNYRTGKEKAVDPALSDVAAALRYILKNRETFGLHSSRYAMAGCSAGVYLTVLWGTKAHGYQRYGLPKPEVLFPTYPFVSPNLWPDNGHEDILIRILGKGYTKTDKDAYDPLPLIDGEYPPCYINCCRDDGEVSCRHSELFAQILHEHDVCHELLLGEYGGHGYGDGHGSDAEGWINHAIRFWESAERNTT